MFRKRKILCLFLALVVMLPMFFSCKKSPEEEKKELFGAKEYTTIETVKGEPFGELKKYGGDLFFLSQDSEKNITFYLNKVTSDGIESKLFAPRGERVSGFDIDGGGNFVFISSSFNTDGDNGFILKKVTPEGDTLEETDITESLSGHISEYTYPESVAVDTDGNVIINAYDRIIALDKDKSFLFDISCETRKLVKFSDGIYAQTSEGNSHCELRRIDIEEKAFGEKIDAAQGDGMSYNLTVYGSKTGLYVSDKSCLYSFDTGTKEKTEILNFSDAGVPGSYIRDIIADGDSFICVGYSDTDKKTFIARISPVSSSEISDKTEIVLAGSEYNIGHQLENQIIKFNNENEKYKIKIKKYGVADFDEKLGLDMAAGNIPDILISDAYTQFESYAEKGLFADLYEFIDNDGELKREDFLPHLMTAMETDGKLLRFCTEFKIFTVLGKTSIFGNEPGLDFDRLDEILKSRPEGTELFTATSRDSILRTAMQLCGDEFIDYKEGRCDFKSEYFLRLLEFANSFPESADYDSVRGRFFDGFADGRSLMLVIYMKDFSDIFWNEHQVFGEETTAVGFPTFSGTGSSFEIGAGFSISAKSKNKDGAWEFIRTLLKKEYQDKTEEFPVRLDSLEEKAVREAESFDINAIRDVKIGDMQISTSGLEIEEKMTEADIDKVMEIINSTVRAYKFDGTVVDIVIEEAGAYFSGSRSEEEAADMIQNRVQTYFSELR